MKGCIELGLLKREMERDDVLLIARQNFESLAIDCNAS